MLVIAERINATSKRVARAMEERDEEFIAREARRQAEAGADFIDVNAGATPAGELESLKWAVGVVQQATDLPICLDSPSPDILRGGLEFIEGNTVMLNSATGEEAKMHSVLKLAAAADALVVALTMDDAGLPKTVDRRVEIAMRLVQAAEEAGIPRGHLYLDPCLQPISTNPEEAVACLESVRRIMTELEGVHTTCGLSNISFGLPNRNLINRTYLASLMSHGLDAAIMDPTDRGMMATVLTGEALMGRDEFCMNYLRAMR